MPLSRQDSKELSLPKVEKIGVKDFVKYSALTSFDLSDAINLLEVAADAFNKDNTNLTITVFSAAQVSLFPMDREYKVIAVPTPQYAVTLKTNAHGTIKAVRTS